MRRSAFLRIRIARRRLLASVKPASGLVWPSVLSEVMAELPATQKSAPRLLTRQLRQTYLRSFRSLLYIRNCLPQPKEFISHPANSAYLIPPPDLDRHHLLPRLRSLPHLSWNQRLNRQQAHRCLQFLGLGSHDLLRVLVDARLVLFRRREGRKRGESFDERVDEREGGGVEGC